MIPIDIQWDHAALANTPRIGRWSGMLALLGRTGSQDGEWQWDTFSQVLDLWVRVQGDHRRLVATLRPFRFPVTTGMTGVGQLQSGLVPTSVPAAFSWVAVVS